MNLPYFLVSLFFHIYITLKSTKISIEIAVKVL